MNLHTLRIFTTVAHLGSVTEASRELHISQPAVTAQIRKLEGEVGVRLIESKGRGMQLTTEGEFLFEQGNRLFQLEAQIDDKLATFLERKEKLHIASSYIPMNFILPSVLASYKKEKPDVEIVIDVGNVLSVEQHVQNYEVDFGFVVHSHTDNADLHFEKVFDVPFWFVVHPNHELAGRTVSLTSLSEEDFIYRERGSSTLDLLEAIFYTHNCKLPNFGLQMQGMHESIKVVEAGYGMTLVPACSVEESVREGRLARVSVEQAEIVQSLFICTRQIEQEEHEFIAFVKNYLKND